jgi:hypothetical protein
MLGEALRLEDGFSGRLVFLAEAGSALLLDLVELPAEHVGDELQARELGKLSGVRHLAVAQDGYAVADLVELLEAVADVDHADPLLAQLPMTLNSVSTSGASSDEVGSSMMTARASTEMARAMATICWTPRPGSAGER